MLTDDEIRLEIQKLYFNYGWVHIANKIAKDNINIPIETAIYKLGYEQGKLDMMLFTE